MLELRVLGGLELRSSGRPVPLPSDARARELLAWLAVHPGRHPRSVVAGRLRPDVPEENARKTVRDAAHRLRTILDDRALDAGREHIGLAGVWVDLAEFRRLRQSGLLEDAVRLDRGELLAGLEADWVLAVRDEHRAELAACLGTLGDIAEARGEHAEAAVWTRRRVELEPLSEATHRDLIRRLALADDRPAALAAADALARRLHRELRLAPSAATRKLVEDVRRGRLGGGRPARAEPSLPEPLRRTARPIGRDGVLETLETVYRDAATGTARLAVVAGEAGIGKTTIAGELARRAQAQDGAVLYGRCDEQALIPYQPWVEIVERQLARDAEAEHWLAVHDGALARLLPTHVADDAPAASRRETYLAFEAVRGLLEAASATRPLLVVVDDLHWADDDSLALLRHLARTLGRAPLLVLLCARGAELTPAARDVLADVRRREPLVELALAGLDEPAVEALLAEHPATAASPADYLRRTGGNPLFLQALLHGGDQAGPPRDVSDVIGRLVALLPEDGRTAIETASVIGAEFGLGPLALLLGRSPVDTLAALDAPIEAGLVVRVGDRGRHAFAHALIHEAVAAELPASQRARLHLDLADRASGAAETVRHLRGAGPLANAERLAAAEVAAAREAAAASAHADAAAHLEAALEHGRDVTLLLELGDAHDRAGDRSRARRAFQEAATLARDAGDTDLLARAALGHGGLAVVIARPDPDTVDLLEEAIAAAPAAARATTARLRARLAVELAYADRAAARAFAANALADARSARDPAALTAALNAWRVALWDPFHVEERLAAVDQMVATAEAAGDRMALLQARNWRVIDLWEVGRMDDVRAEIRVYERLAEEVALPHYLWYVPLWRAGLALIAGRWEETVELGAQALALGDRADDPNAPLLVGIQREAVHVVRGRFEKVDLDWIARTTEATPARAAWLCWQIRVEVARGEQDHARRVLRELTRDGCAALPMDANWLGACELADVAVTLDDREAAAALHALLEPHARLHAVVARGATSKHVTEHYLGRLAFALGRVDEAEGRLRRAVGLDDAAGAAAYATDSVVALGHVLTARGDQAAARAAFEDALHRARHLDMPLRTAEAHAALAR
jgi:DNA-binding SARP family transcriptional activator